MYLGAAAMSPNGTRYAYNTPKTSSSGATTHVVYFAVPDRRTGYELSTGYLSVPVLPSEQLNELDHLLHRRSIHTTEYLM